MNLQNTPLAGAMRASIHQFSNFSSTPVKKRSNVKGWLDVCNEEGSVLAYPGRQASAPSGSVGIDRESGVYCMIMERGPDVDGDTRQSQRRALPAAVHAIKEKQRNHLQRRATNRVKLVYSLNSFALLH